MFVVLSGNIFFRGVAPALSIPAHDWGFDDAYTEVELGNQMDDPTDTALAVCTGVGLALCCLAAFWSACRRGDPGYGIKVSRSDPDLENLQDIVADSIPSHK